MTMDANRWEALLEGVLHQTLSPAEEEELLRALRENPDREAQLVRLLEQEELLSAALNPGRSEDAFEEQVRLRVQGRDDTPFVRAVLDRARHKRTRRRAAGLQGKPGGWNPMFIAAGILFGVVLLGSILFSPDDRPPAPRKSPAAAETRREMEARLRDIDRKREELSKPQALPTANPAEDEKRRNALQALQDEKTRIEEEMKRAIELAKPARTDIPDPRPQPSAPPERTESQPLARTQAIIATVEEAAGEAFILTPEGRTPAKDGAGLGPAQGIETGGAGRVVLRFPDQTRVDLGPESLVIEVKVDSGKRVAVTRGSLRADVAKQPKDQPMVFATPHGDAKVLGTTLRLIIDPDSKKGTRLDVDEGKVELKNLGGKTVEVLAGQYAVAAAGVVLTAKAISTETPIVALLENTGAATISFGLPGRTLPPGILIDSGEPFDLKRGYGWQGTNDLMRVPGADPVRKRRPHSGEGPNDEDLRGSRINGGGVDTVELWILKVPKGRYLVTVCAGSYTGAGFGPHHVQIEGTQVIDAAKTQQGEFVEKKDVAVEVKDGLMRMLIGGHRRRDATRVPWYGPDTALNYIQIRKAP